MRTHIDFGAETVELTEQAVTAFAGYATPAGSSVRASLGVLVGGSLDGDATVGTHDLGRGIVGALGVAHQWPIGDGLWFVTGSASISVAAASTHEAGASDDPRFVAGDARIGATAGRTFGKTVAPYVLARAFGGPVWWTIGGMDTTGGDTRHFQLGGGLSVATTFGLTVVVDLSVLGEQAASLGVSMRL
jgi:hypothetical protein